MIVSSGSDKSLRNNSESVTLLLGGVGWLEPFRFSSAKSGCPPLKIGEICITPYIIKKKTSVYMFIYLFKAFYLFLF